MKIIIIGAGEVGFHLARNLSWQDHEITVLDVDQQRIDRISSQLDVLAIRGSGTSAHSLWDAGAAGADLLIAVTSIDEVNIVSCTLARELGVKTRIARVRNREYSQPDMPVSLHALGIDQVINPEGEAAKEVVRMIRYQEATNVVECADGKILLIGLQVGKDSPILNRPLMELIPLYPQLSLRLTAIQRSVESSPKTIIPKGKDVIYPHDYVYVMVHQDDIPQLFQLAGKSSADSSNDVMILGGGRIGRNVAEVLEKDRRYNIKLVEGDYDRSQTAAEQLVNTMVVRSREGIDIDLLALEGLSGMGVFAALTDDDENNIVTSLFARHLKVKRIITLVSRPEYMAILKAIGLNTAINERVLTSDAILKYLLGGKIMAVSSLRGIDAEIIEFVVAEESKINGKKVKDIPFPAGCIVGGIEHRGEVFVAVGDSMLMAGDRAVVFALPKAIPSLKKLFSS